MAADTLEDTELLELLELMELELPVGPVYPFRHAVLIKQARRMRSNEVHYIDHPLLGLIIKFTPVSDQELAAIAELQESNLEDAQAL